MKKATAVLSRLLHPPIGVLVSVPTVVFAALIFLFAAGKTECALAYPVYCLSAYSLAVLLAAVPPLAKRVKSAILHSGAAKRAASSAVVGRYLTDAAFRGSVSLYQGVIVNFFYVVFRIVAGIRYASVWFFSMAVYYLVLGGLRAYLIVHVRRRGAAREERCYRRTAWLLFLLNLPMGGMIVLMVRTNSGFVYPGYIIYLSALYTFYAAIMSIVNLIKFRKLGSPLLSAAKVLNFVSALMSVLGLQTAMISRFSSEGEEFRRLMNAVTGGCVYGLVFLTAVVMLLHSRKAAGKGENSFE